MAAEFTFIAHRGDHRRHPENSAAAFAAAWQAGFRAVELDLVTLADGTVAIFHDATTARHGGAPPRPVAELTAPELAAVVPDLMLFEDFVERFADRDWLVNLEIKDGPETVAAIAPALARFREPVISSFRRPAVEAAAAAGWPVAFLFATLAAYQSADPPLPPGSRLHVHKNTLLDDPAAIPPAWSTSEVYAYTVNDAAELARLRDLPFVRGVFTDRPELRG